MTKLNWKPIYRFFLQTVDQFFALKVPMRPGELKSLFRGIDNAFQVYTKHVMDSLGIVFMHLFSIWSCLVVFFMYSIASSLPYSELCELV